MQPHRQQPNRLRRPWNSPGKNTGVGCHFLLQCMKVKSESEVAQSCPTPSDPMDCSPPGSSIHGISQARGLEWGAILFSRGSSWTRWARTSCSSCLAGGFLTTESQGSPVLTHKENPYLGYQMPYTTPLGVIKHSGTYPNLTIKWLYLIIIEMRALT